MYKIKTMNKKLNILAILFIVTVFSANARIWTVNNNNNSPGELTDLQLACDTASAGDTILVSGSATSYGEIYIRKQLTLIGAGYNPNNQDKLYSKISYCRFANETDDFGNIINVPDHSSVMGFLISSMWNNIANASDITIQYNNIGMLAIYGSDVSNADNWLISNNYISSEISGTEYLTNCVISNNIISGSLASIKSNTVIISNNIIIGDSYFFIGEVSPAAMPEYLTVSNNIFYGKSTEGADNSTFNNNISFMGSQTNFDYDNNVSNNNIEATNPQFVNAPDFIFDYTDDFHLAAGSPGINAGTDGTDIGIYGGMYPWQEEVSPFMNSPMPNIPQVIEMSILTPFVPIDSQLNVHIKAKKQD